MTVLDATPAAVASPATRVRASLTNAELRRFTSRRFIRVLLLLFAAGYVVVVGLAAATSFAKTTPEQLAAAERNIAEVVAEQEMFRQQCLDDPNLPDDLPAEQVCGPSARAADFRVEDFLDKQPFVLADGLPAGSAAMAGGTAALAFLLGATYVGAEWSSRSMVALLFWEPRRMRVMAVKIGVLVGAAALLTVVGQAIWWGTARVMSAALGKTGDLSPGFYGDLLAQQGRAVVLVVLAALLGFGVANLVRNTGAALGVGFLYFAVIETAVRNLRGGRYQEWLLTDNAAALLLEGGHRIYVYGGGYVDDRGTYVDSSRELVLNNLHGGLMLAAVTALVVAIGALLFSRRDLH